jgi:hypothetical protein
VRLAGRRQRAFLGGHQRQVGAEEVGQHAAPVFGGGRRYDLYDLGLEPDQVIEGPVVAGHGLR